MGWLYVPGSEDWSWDSNSPLAKTTNVWVTVNGIPSQRPCSWHAWKTRSWIKRLFGTILQPSQANSTAKRWISFLLASLASHSRPQENNLERMTPDGSGPCSTESFARYDHDYCFWKTSQGSLLGDLPMFSDPWPKSGSMRNGVVIQRQKSVPPISEKEYSLWLTPKASEHGEKSETFVKRMGDRNQGAFSGLMDQAKSWPTPRATDGDKDPHAGFQGRLRALRREARLWQTPKAHDAQDTVSASEMRRNSPSLPAQAIGMDGKDTMDLNPQFVEALMSWPIKWTGSEPVGTEWFHWLQLMRSELSRLVQG